MIFKDEFSEGKDIILKKKLIQKISDLYQFCSDKLFYRGYAVQR